MKTTESDKLFNKACKLIPGGVNSPVRSFSSVKGNPIYIVRGEESRIYDADGNEYIDFCGSWGPLILGHSDPHVVESVGRTASYGLTFGANNPLEVEMAELLDKFIPHAEMFRAVSSGTEAVMTALRLARGVTGKRIIIKFDGCYHGHSDGLLVSAGSGLLTNSVTSSAGVTKQTASETVSIPYNDTDAVKKVFAKFADDIAAVIIEPIAGNMGLIKPDKSYLGFLREICDEYNSLLIFDEVITGFRFHCGVYSDLAGVTPDITTLGKIIGGGMPFGAVASTEKIMNHLAPLGNVYQAGTLSGNPVALAAGIATIRKLYRDNPYPSMAENTAIFADTINQYAEKHNLNVCCASYGSAFTLFFRKTPPQNLNEVKECNTELFAEYHRSMLENGIYLAPSQFELNFVSAAHTPGTVKIAADKAIKVISKLFSVFQSSDS